MKMFIKKRIRKIIMMRMVSCVVTLATMPTLNGQEQKDSYIKDNFCKISLEDTRY